jgi:hypothetical protein
MGFLKHTEIAFGGPEVSLRTPVVLDYRIVAESYLQVKEKVRHPQQYKKKHREDYYKPQE